MSRFAMFEAGRCRSVLGTLAVLVVTVIGPQMKTLVAGDDSIEVGRAVKALAATCLSASDLHRNSRGVGIYDDGPYLVGTQLAFGETRTGTFQFRRGVEYLLIGWGDNDARDLDIRVLNEDLEVVAMDVANDARPVVTIRPTHTGNYTVELKLFCPGTGGNPSFCCMMILQEDGWNVPFRNCEDAVINLAKVANFVVDHEKGVTTISSGDCWSVCGVVLRPQEFYSNTNLQLRRGRHVLIGAGDSNAVDLDNKVESLTGPVLGQDEAADAYPITAFRSDRERLKTTISLPRSAGASLVLQAMLQVD